MSGILSYRKVYPYQFRVGSTRIWSRVNAALKNSILKVPKNRRCSRQCVRTIFKSLHAKLHPNWSSWGIHVSGMLTCNLCSAF